MKNKIKKLSFILIAATLIMVFFIFVFTAKNAFADTDGTVLESTNNNYSESNDSEIKSEDKIYCNADIAEKLLF